MKTIALFLGKYYFIEVFCCNSDEEYYDEECINLFLKTLVKQVKNIKKKKFKLGTLNFPPEI